MKLFNRQKIFNSWNKQSHESAIFRNMMKLITGDGIARIIGLVSAPIITRIYLPEHMGVLSVFSSLIDIIPKKINKWITLILSIFMFINILITTLAVERQSQRRKNVEAKNTISQFFDEHYNDEYLKDKFPNMTVVK